MDRRRCLLTRSGESGVLRDLHAHQEQPSYQRARSSCNPLESNIGESRRGGCLPTREAGSAAEQPCMTGKLLTQEAAGLSLLDGPRRETGDVVIEEEDVEDDDGHGPQNGARHELAPEV